MARSNTSPAYLSAFERSLLAEEEGRGRNYSGASDRDKKKVDEALRAFVDATYAAQAPSVYHKSIVITSRGFGASRRF